MYLYLELVLLVFVRFVEGEVVDNDFTGCKSFFYKSIHPRGFPDREHKAICQRYGNRFHFATLHSSRYRIPLYSAYRLDDFNCNPNQPKRRSKWFIEPQLSGPTFTRNMTTEGTLVDTYKRVQAINIDYPNTNFDRGHLNPNFYQCDDSRTATFTLTNAVPQDPCFNQQMWKKYEERSKNIMKELCSFDGARRFFITGAIPGDSKIPSKLRDNESDQQRDYDRVQVPKVMWTVACCDSSLAIKPEDKDKGFQLCYYGENEPDSYVIPCRVADLETYLNMMSVTNAAKLFNDDCYSVSENSKRAAAKLAVLVERKIAEILVSISLSRESSISDAEETFLKSVSVNLKDNIAVSLKNWTITDADFGLIEKRGDIQITRSTFAKIGLTPLLTAPNYFIPVRAPQSALRNASVSNNSSSVNLLKNEISLKPADSSKGAVKESISERNSSLDAAKRLVETTDKYVVVPLTERTLTASGSRCRQRDFCDYRGQKYKWCYIDWSNKWDYCCEKRCAFEQNTNYAWCYTSNGTNWAYCSQRSSMITVVGKHCIAGHECGLHGGVNHWCYTDLIKNWEYCCQPWHECANHGETYKWCYVGRSYKSNWKNCEY